MSEREGRKIGEAAAASPNAPRALAKALNRYFFKAQEDYSRMNDIMLDAGELISTPLALPDDDIWQRAANFIGGKAVLLCRDAKTAAARAVKKSALELYEDNRGIFNEAAALAGAPRAGISVDLPFVKIDPSLENEGWIDDLQALADQVRGFIDDACALAEDLIGRLEKAACPASPR